MGADFRHLRKSDDISGCAPGPKTGSSRPTALLDGPGPVRLDFKRSAQNPVASDPETALVKKSDGEGTDFYYLATVLSVAAGPNKKK